MAKPELIAILSRLSKKIDSLLLEQQNLRSQVKELQAKNTELTQQHKSDVEKLLRAQKEIEFLSISHRLAASPEALVAARNKVSQMLRTIDSCIRMINED